MKTLLRMTNAMLAPFGARFVASHRIMSGDDALRRLSTMFPEPNTVIDIGCAAGTWSDRALRCFANAKILGLEPLQEREGDLTRLRQRNPRFDYALAAAGASDKDDGRLLVAGDLDGSTMTTAAGAASAKAWGFAAPISRTGCCGPATTRSGRWISFSCAET